MSKKIAHIWILTKISKDLSYSESVAEAESNVFTREQSLVDHIRYEYNCSEYLAYEEERAAVAHDYEWYHEDIDYVSDVKTFIEWYNEQNKDDECSLKLETVDLIVDTDDLTDIPDNV